MKWVQGWQHITLCTYPLSTIKIPLCESDALESSVRGHHSGEFLQLVNVSFRSRQVRPSCLQGAGKARHVLHYDVENPMNSSERASLQPTPQP